MLPLSVGRREAAPIKLLALATHSDDAAIGCGGMHEDHRITCELTWNTFRNHFILEYEVPKYDGDMGALTSSCR